MHDIAAQRHSGQLALDETEVSTASLNERSTN